MLAKWKSAIRHKEKNVGRRLSLERRALNRAILQGGDRQSIMQNMFRDKLPEGFELKPGHAAVLSTCPNKLPREVLQNEEDRARFEAELRNIDLAALPVKLLCPILYYHRKRSSPAGIDQEAVQNLQLIRQCSSSAGEEKEEASAAAASESVRQELARLQAEHTELKEQYVTNHELLMGLIRKVKDFNAGGLEGRVQELHALAERTRTSMA